MNQSNFQSYIYTIWFLSSSMKVGILLRTRAGGTSREYGAGGGLGTILFDLPVARLLAKKQGKKLSSNRKL